MNRAAEMDEDDRVIVPEGDPRPWLRSRLRPLDDPGGVPDRVRGDHDLNPAWMKPEDRMLRPAAVLVPIVHRAAGLTVLLTRRSKNLNSHAGQVAFPGGRVDPTDRDIVHAAMRETMEETGIGEAFITPVGLLDPYETGSSFQIHPVVGVLREGFTPVPSPHEVDEIFEVPFAFLMDAANHQAHTGFWQGQERRYYAMPFHSHNIWGATAGMIVNLRERLAGGE
jgi:8-oxo-dGTP pyrophosphatase MutT (NUDIX family)